MDDQKKPLARRKKIVGEGKAVEKKGSMGIAIPGGKFHLIDVNGNDTIQYVMLEGEAGHQDTLVRTNVCTSELVKAGFTLEKLGDEYANWDRDQAKTKMSELIGRYPFQIEMVIANDDDMDVPPSLRERLKGKKRK